VTSSPVRLIPMMCMKCSQPVIAQPGEVAWLCSTCGQGLLLGSDGALQTLGIFFSPGIKPGAKGRPFWVAPGQVTITERQTYQGNSAREAAEFWGQGRLFFIPAYQIALEDLVAAGMALLKTPVNLTQPASPAAFVPVTTGPEDIRPLAEFIVLAAEADRRDALKTLQFDLKLQSPQLWILP
jgi:hypothetical protein